MPCKLPLLPLSKWDGSVITLGLHHRVIQAHTCKRAADGRCLVGVWIQQTNCRPPETTLGKCCSCGATPRQMKTWCVCVVSCHSWALLMLPCRRCVCCCVPRCFTVAHALTFNLFTVSPLVAILARLFVRCCHRWRLLSLKSSQHQNTTQQNVGGRPQHPRNGESARHEHICVP